MRTQCRRIYKNKSAAGENCQCVQHLASERVRHVFLLASHHVSSWKNVAKVFLESFEDKKKKGTTAQLQRCTIDREEVA